MIGVRYNQSMPDAALPIAVEQNTPAVRGVYTNAERELLRQPQLPEEDETPSESHYHALQQQLLAEVIHQHFKERTDYFCGTNMLVYYSLEQAQRITDFVEGRSDRAPYKGPDLLVVVGVDGTKRRKHWVVWDEDDRFPDLIALAEHATQAVIEAVRRRDMLRIDGRPLQNLSPDEFHALILARELASGQRLPSALRLLP